MSAPRPIEIVGGGLAGLSLGLALRRADVPVTVFEAGDYPRHRVCGEFITGLHPETVERLGLAPVLADAEPHRAVTWFQGGEACRQVLPETAWAISRHVLDERLARAFVEAGGDLRTRTRVDPAELKPGRINTSGRRRAGTPWVGLKAHVNGLTLDHGLELHLGHDAYVGLCALPGGDVNVCGLFRRRPLHDESKEGALPAYLRASGLERLADRLGTVEVRADSRAAVAGLGFDRPVNSADLRLGDAYGMLPPFLGNGMAAAFQMAEEALGPLRSWSRESAKDWRATCALIRRRLHRRFRRRILWSNALHPFLLAEGKQRWFAWLARGPSLPLDFLYRALH